MSVGTDCILQMLEDVKKRDGNKQTLFPMYVQKRLDKSVNNYYKQLINSRNTLSQLSNKRVIKNLIKQ